MANPSSPHDPDDFRLVVDSIPGLVFTLGVKGELEFANRQMLDYLGVTREELSTWPPPAFIHLADLGRVGELCDESLTTGVAHECELRLRGADAVYRWFQLRCSPGAKSDGRVVHWYGCLSEIDGLQQAKIASREELRSLEILIDSIPGLVFTTRANGELEWTNRTIQAYFGRSLAELQRWQMTDVVHPEDLPNTIARVQAGATSGQPYDFEQRLLRHDGAYRWVHYRAAPLRDETGEIVRWAGLVTDIDDSKRAEEDVRRIQSHLAKASQLAAVSEFAASIAHEINQPLVAVIASGHACHRWLSADPPNVERAMSSIERTIRDGASAAQIVSRIRSLFRHAPPAKQILDVNEVIEEVGQLIADELLSRGISLRLELQPNLPPAEVDRVQLQQVVVNLARNGIDAMDAIVGRPKHLDVATVANTKEIIVRIADAGVGLTDPDAVFEPFYTTKTQGMGMGLAICRTILDAHDGRLWAAKNATHGATFAFTLPVAATLPE